jgi:hypothetical protein
MVSLIVSPISSVIQKCININKFVTPTTIQSYIKSVQDNLIELWCNADTNNPDAVPVNINADKCKELLQSAMYSKICYNDPDRVEQLRKDCISGVCTDKATINALDKMTDYLFISSNAKSIQDAQVYVWKDGGFNITQQNASPKNKTLYVAFRATTNFKDALTDLNAFTYHVKGDILVHSGFYNHFLSVEKEITSVIERVKNNIDTIQFVGHSLGGSAAQIASAYYGEKFKSLNIKCHTFGTPRSGNGAFVEWFNSSCNEHYRITNENDIIPLMLDTPVWSHAFKNALYLYEDGRIRFQYRDVPWWIRVAHIMAEVDLSQPIESHLIDNYILRISRAIAKTVVIPPPSATIVNAGPNASLSSTNILNSIINYSGSATITTPLATPLIGGLTTLPTVLGVTGTNDNSSVIGILSSILSSVPGASTLSSLAGASILSGVTGVTGTNDNSSVIGILSSILSSVPGASTLSSLAGSTGTNTTSLTIGPTGISGSSTTSMSGVTGLSGSSTTNVAVGPSSLYGSSTTSVSGVTGLSGSTTTSVTAGVAGVAGSSTTSVSGVTGLSGSTTTSVTAGVTGLSVSVVTP